MHQCHKHYLLVLSLKNGRCSGFEYHFQTIDSLRPVPIEELLGRDLITAKLDNIKPGIMSNSSNTPPKDFNERHMTTVTPPIIIPLSALTFVIFFK